MVLRQRDDRERPEHAHPHRVQRQLRPGDVGDHEVVQARPGGQACGHPVQRRRRVRRETDEELGADGLLVVLHVLHRLVDHLQALGGIHLVDRERDEDRRDTVAEQRLVAVGSHRDRDHHAHLQPLGRLATATEEAADRVADDREHDVVHGGPEGVLHVLHLVQRDALDRVAAERAVASVQRARRCRTDGRRHREEALSHLSDPFEETTRTGVPQATDAAQQRPRASGRLAERRDGAPDVARRRRRVPRPRRRDLPLVAIGVEQERRDVDPGDPVDHGVVGLAEVGHAVVLEALDHVELPQRAAPVQLTAHDAADVLGQLVDAAGSRQRRVPHVVGDVEVPVVDPHRGGDAERCLGQLLSEPWHEVQPGLDEVEEAREVELVVGGRLEDEQPAGVHVLGGCLEPQEGRVEGAEPVTVSLAHPGPSSRGPMVGRRRPPVLRRPPVARRRSVGSARRRGCGSVGSASW